MILFNDNVLFGDIRRTLSIVEQLSDGKRLTLPDGHTIAMAEDMSIGFVFHDKKGKESIGGLSTMDLKQLNDLLNKYEIGFIIPK